MRTRVAKPTSRQMSPPGRAGEGIAADYLEGKGYVIVARNWRSPQTRNEIDLIVEDGDCLVFVEVKTARTTRFGDPVTWIPSRKQAAIARAAAAYRVALKPRHREFRFDAIAIGPPARGRKRALTHVTGAFTLGEGWTV
ncbi:MAG: YraN family protein [Candidatus Zixiibacteriota bacterium]